MPALTSMAMAAIPAGPSISGTLATLVADAVLAYTVESTSEQKILWQSDMMEIPFSKPANENKNVKKRIQTSRHSNGIVFNTIVQLIEY